VISPTVYQYNNNNNALSSYMALDGALGLLKVITVFAITTGCYHN